VHVCILSYIPCIPTLSWFRENSLLSLLKLAYVRAHLALHRFVHTPSPVAYTRRGTPQFVSAAMAGLISPKPLSYMQHAGQFNPYQQRFSAGTTLSAYSETPTILQSHQSHILGFQEESKIYALVIDLLDPNTREAALLELSKKREQYDDLALVLWHSFGMFIHCG